MAGQQATTLLIDSSDLLGVRRATSDLQADIERVTGVSPKLVSDQASAGSLAVIVGTLGDSRLVDSLVESGKLNVEEVAGKWESFVIATLEDPMPGLDRALVIAGSDRRGTIFGIYEISKQIGVSPWYWWADVPTRHRDSLHIKAGVYVQGPPKVKYRGIFINDEEPAFGRWSREKFGGINSKMYSHVFELILRLRGNYLWPAMWSSGFGETDAQNPKVANEYGIVVGTSHHEPMMRAHQEWSRHKNEYGNGKWNYGLNTEGLQKFFREGIQRTKDFDNLVTVGMRGDGDAPMTQQGQEASNIDLMERIVADQREILADIVNPDVTNVPQIWALYKEVADYYQHGMQVPDDVTLLWCDDNWGNIRRMPTREERNRAGGAGVYYHFDYVGSPRSYKWLNTSPLPKIWQQMSMAYDYGADRVWIVNVGDLKPMEVPIEFFLDLAWDPEALPKEKIEAWTVNWAKRNFCEKHSTQIADIVSKYAKYNGWRKPELLDPTTFSLTHYREAERVQAAWQSIVQQAEQINAELPTEYRDAFYQLVLYPTKASATVAELYIETGRNHLYAGQGRVSSNQHAQRVRELFAQDKQLSDAYHQLGGGNWNHMMSQTRIGYTSWSDPKQNILPQLKEVTPKNGAVLGVAVEGSEAAWPGELSKAKLPALDAINQQLRWIDVFNRGSESFEFSATANRSWVKLSSVSGSVDTDQRIWLSVDWDKISPGKHDAVVTISQLGGRSVDVQVAAVQSDQFTREQTQALGGLIGSIAFSVDQAKSFVPSGNASWEIIPDYGRGSAGVTLFPTTSPAMMPPAEAPRLEYPVLFAEAGDYQIDLITGSSLNVQPNENLRVAISLDHESRKIIDAFTGQAYEDPSKRGDTSAPAIKDWGKWVRNNARTLTCKQRVNEAGVHTLKIWAVDPGLVLQKVIIHKAPLPYSYFGPPVNPIDDLEHTLVTRVGPATAHHWVTTWATAAEEIKSGFWMAKGYAPPVPLENSTIRMFLRNSMGGERLRLRFSNVFGTSPVTINTAHIALAAKDDSSATDGDINTDTDTKLKFDGDLSVVIPPGETVYCDPVDFTLPDLSVVAVSIHYGKTQDDPVTGHRGSRTTSFFAKGNAVAVSDMAEQIKKDVWYTLTGIEVLAPSSSKTVVAIGDSITDGNGTKYNYNTRWTDYLATRLSKHESTSDVGVANMGIGGSGVRMAMERFQRDVLDQHAARWLVLLIGVNDIVYGKAPASKLIDAYMEMARRAHENGLKVYGATITPMGGAASVEQEQVRQEVNAWIRTTAVETGVFDACVDFDRPVLDELDNTSMRSAYKKDDLHLNPTGYQALADAIDLNLFVDP
ncbi:lysophospholipase L1-like esterase [Rhodopirellula rubra]|uniref:Lysophospholipase L1-like esterase n=1 Tax=Aporhodopirellula rubra TaxID=980271 RepID=A0A7W5DX60_9BACT|nr:glycosyl hydrolase 115 family protein [Aporhodopirellula rubra]MBB3206174.1 lysophospholipase L1-like esterase [Aporhodopirellula rubra]